MTGNVINLNRWKKQQARAEERRLADENAVRHGRTKAQISTDEARLERLKEHLDRLRLDE